MFLSTCNDTLNVVVSLFLIFSIQFSIYLFFSFCIARSIDFHGTKYISCVCFVLCKRTTALLNRSSSFIATRVKTNQILVNKFDCICDNKFHCQTFFLSNSVDSRSVFNAMCIFQLCRKTMFLF